MKFSKYVDIAKSKTKNVYNNCKVKVNNVIDSAIEKRNKANNEVKEEKYICPKCGTELKFDDIVCPVCNTEVKHGKSSALKDFYAEYGTIILPKNKIDFVRSFPVPTTRQDIIEFMMYASTNFDVDMYLKKKGKDSLASAWLSKIEQCYQKAKFTFKDKKDLDTIEDIYKNVNDKIKKESNKKKLYAVFLLISAIVLIVVCYLIGKYL